MLKWIVLALVLTGPVFNWLGHNIMIGYVVSLISAAMFIIMDIKDKNSK